MSFLKANIFINLASGLSFSTQQGTDVAYAYTEEAFDILRKFDRIVFGFPQSAAEEDLWYQMLTARQRAFPEAKFYGYTSKAESDLFTAWAQQELAWKNLYGSILNGIYIANFDATDIQTSVSPQQGTFTRAEQNLAVTGCHNDGYEVFAESRYPELTLGGAATEEIDSLNQTLIGRDADITDAIIVKSYLSEVATEARSARAREGVAIFVRDFAARPDIKLYTALSLNSPDHTHTILPIDMWRTLTDEVSAYGIDGFGVDVTESDLAPDVRWFSTNAYPFDTFSPALSNDPAVSYARLYGRVFPTIAGESATPLILKYERTDTLTADNPYFDNKGEVSITPDADGNWSVLIGAAPSPGTAYRLTLALDETPYRPVVKENVVLIGGQSHAY